MTIKECIDIVDNIKPNQYTVKEKVGWLSFIDEIIINDVLKTHEGYDGRYDNFEGYSENKLSQTLIVPSPYDRLYTEYLKMRIDGENGEMAKYNNSAELFNSHMMEYRKYYNKTHMPLDVTRKNSRPNQKQGSLNLPDAVIENITRDLYARLSEDFAEMTSQDKIYDVVMSYVMNNAAMLKGQPGKEGEPGYSPIKGIDYFTEAEKEELVSLVIKNIRTTLNGKEDVANKVYEIDFYGSGIDDINYPTTKAVYNFTWATALDAANQAKQEIRTFDIDPIRSQIQNEAHFRGYLSTNAKVKALKATPNDFAYSAESGTKWVYDAQGGWIDTNSPVPDQLTPASETIPLVDGTASVGTENAYARGDHRHPTDTTRASVEQVNNLKSDIESRTPRLVKKVVVAEDVNSVTITTDEEGNPFSLTDFEIRFTGKHSTTLWIQLNKGEKYFSTNQVANNQGLPFFNTVSGYSTQNVVVRYIFSGSNFYGTRFRQEIGALGSDGKYAAGAGDVAPFNTTPVSSPATNIVVKATSDGLINAGTVIEVWGC